MFKGNGESCCVSLRARGRSISYSSPLPCKERVALAHKESLSLSLLSVHALESANAVCMRRKERKGEKERRGQRVHLAGTGRKRRRRRAPRESTEGGGSTLVGIHPKLLETLRK